MRTLFWDTCPFCMLILSLNVCMEYVLQIAQQTLGEKNILQGCHFVEVFWKTLQTAEKKSELPVMLQGC